VEEFDYLIYKNWFNDNVTLYLLVLYSCMLHLISIPCCLYISMQVILFKFYVLLILL